MDLLRAWTVVGLRWRSLRRRAEVEQELDEEIAYHLERLTAEYEARGLSPAAARAAARIDIGGVSHTKERCRDERRLRWLDDLVQDTRVAMRGMRRRPGSTVVALLTLALGVGATTAVVSVVDGVWLKSPYPDADRIVWIFEQMKSGQNIGVSAANYLDWREQSRSFESMAAWSFATSTLSSGDTPASLRTAFVTASYFDVFGIRPALGRVLTPADEQRGNNRAVVISHETWMTYAGGDPGIVGRDWRLRGDLYTVVGVLPPGANVGEWAWTQIWLPRTFNRATAQRNFGGFNVFAKLRPDVTFQQAQAEMTGIAVQLARAYPKEIGDNTIWLQPYKEGLVDEQLRRSLALLFAAVVAVLLIAAVNLASVRLVSALAQERDSAIRAALGGGGFRLVRQFATESLLLAGCGTLLGVAIAWGLVAALQSTLPEFSSAGSGIPPREAIALDARTLMVAVVLSVTTSVACGLAPALVALRANVLDSMIDRKSGSTGGVRGWWRRGLVALEVALALVLVVTALDLLNGIREMRQRPVGFDPVGVLTGEMPLPNVQRDATPDVRQRYFEQIIAAVEDVPGVSSVALASALPLMGYAATMAIQRADRAPVAPADRTLGFFKMITPDYFATLRLELRSGRGLTRDDRAGAPRVVVINETLARLLFPNDDPIGRTLLMPEIIVGAASRISDDLPWEVVGVVEDERVERLRIATISPGVYVSIAQDVTRAPSIVVRTLPVAGMELAVRRAVAGVNRDQALANVRWLDRMMDESLGSDRQRSWVVAAFALSALLLAAIGIYGVMSHLVAARTHELGIRAAVGARAGQLAGLVVRDGLLLAGAGVVLGATASLGTSRLLRAWVENLMGVNPATFWMGVLLMGAVAVVACAVPALRATRVDPLLALRAE